MTTFLKTPREFLYSLAEKLPVRHNGDIENSPSTMELGKTETVAFELSVAEAPEETCIEPLPGQFETIFVPDFLYGERSPENLEAVPTHACDYLLARTYCV